MDNPQNSSILHENEQMKAYPPLDKNKLKLNPFSQELVIPCTKWVETGKYAVDEQGVPVSTYAIVDKAKCTKVYHSAGLRDMAMRLSPGGLKLLMWMIYDVEDGNDWIRVMPEMYAKHGGKGCSRTQYKKAVDELIDAGYICMTQFKCTYWINPAILYPGSRKNKWPEKCVIKNTW